MTTSELLEKETQTTNNAQLTPHAKTTTYFKGKSKQTTL